jgi:hypothetical protein
MIWLSALTNDIAMASSMRTGQAFRWLNPLPFLPVFSMLILSSVY